MAAQKYLKISTMRMYNLIPSCPGRLVPGFLFLSVFLTFCPDTLQAQSRQQRFKAGVIAGIDAVGGHLQKYFPVDPEKDINELPNKPVVL